MRGLLIAGGVVALLFALLLAIAITCSRRISDEELQGLVRGGQGRDERAVLEGTGAIAWCVIVALVWVGAWCLSRGLSE